MILILNGVKNENEKNVIRFKKNLIYQDLVYRIITFEKIKFDFEQII